MRTGAELVVDSLIALDSEVAFLLPGFGIQPLAEAFDARRDEIRMVGALNETNLALIANGYAQGSGRPVFANVYHASGTALAMMGLTTAWADQVPLVLTTTTTSRANAGRDGYAAVPRAITEMSQQFTKWSAEVTSADRIPELLERAFAIAATPPMGPVHLAFPMDLYLEEVAEEPARIRLRKPEPSVTAGPSIRRVADAILAARRPLIVAGGEVSRYGAVASLVAFAEASGAAVATEEFPNRLAFPTTHPQFLGNVSDVGDLGEFDLIVTCGAEFTERRARNTLASPTQPVIQLMTGSGDILKQVRSDAVLVGDLRLTMEGLTQALATSEIQRIPADIHAYRERRSARLEEVATAGWDDVEPMRAGRIIAELEKETRNCLIVNQAGTNAVYLDMLYPFDDPGRYFGISARGSAQGWAVPAAIGIQLACPDQRVVAFVGDGGLLFTGTALYTAAQHRIPTVFVIVENGGWRDIAASSRSIRGKAHEREATHGWTFLEPEIDYEAFIASFGIRVSRVASPEALSQALREALHAEEPAAIVVSSDPADVDFYFS